MIYDFFNNSGDNEAIMRWIKSPITERQRSTLRRKVGRIIVRNH